MVVINSNSNRMVVTNNKATAKVTVNNKDTKVAAMEDTKPKLVLTDNKHLRILPMVQLLKLSHPLCQIGKVRRLQMDRFTITINEQERLNGTNQLGCRKVFVFLSATLFSFAGCTLHVPGVACIACAY